MSTSAPGVKLESRYPDTGVRRMFRLWPQGRYGARRGTPGTAERGHSTRRTARCWRSATSWTISLEMPSALAPSGSDRRFELTGPNPCACCVRCSGQLSRSPARGSSSGRSGSRKASSGCAAIAQDPRTTSVSGGTWGLREGEVSGVSVVRGARASSSWASGGAIQRPLCAQFEVAYRSRGIPSSRGRSTTPHSEPAQPSSGPARAHDECRCGAARSPVAQAAPRVDMR